MKDQKDRLYKVIVIGATPAGIAATNKLGEMGIPVTLIDSEPDLDQKFSREEWRTPSGLSFNFAYRPGLLRILRNPLIRCLLPAEVASLRHTPQGFRVGLNSSPTYIDPELCTLCGRCVETCPVKAPSGEKPIRFNGRKSLPGRPFIDKRRRPPCQTNCPLGVNAQAYLALAGAGRFREALDIVRSDNILPGICGRVCTHPCEEGCRRGELDESIAIRDVKRFLADYELSDPAGSAPPEIPQRKEKIAIIGSGPAGLAAAADLARLGYQTTVLEKEAMAGGLLRYGIGSHRLPRDILDGELGYIERLGVRLKTSQSVKVPEDLEGLGGDFDAVILATGAGVDRRLGIPGEDLAGVEGCLSFLRMLYQGQVKDLTEKVAVIGDGNAAFDLARTLKRLGADVTILSWFPEALIPAEAGEIRGAREEGIRIVDSTQVISFSGQEGRLDHLRCRPTRPGKADEKGIPWPEIVPESESFDLRFDRAIVAIGQTRFLAGEARGRALEVDESFRTNVRGLYAAGDAVRGPSSVVDAMAAGRAVARSVHGDLSGMKVKEKGRSRPEERDFPAIPPDIPSLARSTMPERQPAARKDNFSEVALGFGDAQVRYEAGRCLQCGICSECLLCEEACSLIGAIRHEETAQRNIEQAGVLIIADPEAAPAIKGEDVIRAYGPKAARSDVHAMITRGFAAAARAMNLLGGSPQRPKGHGVSFSPPDPRLSSEIRVGVFVCRCNDTFGWSDEMDEYVGRLVAREGVVHAQTLPSACVPEGAADILKTIREKGVTRVVLASCVCCPLDFVCSACTDQRSRLKDLLFKGTGLSRSMVETCNLRGEALRHLQHDSSLALALFEGLLERSIKRAERLRPLPAPARTYNFTTAVIGESEAALYSAQTLAESGFEVFIFGRPGASRPAMVSHPNIHCFENSLVRDMNGTLGDFRLYVESNGFSQVLQVGVIILGERSRRQIPYIHQEGLPAYIVSSDMQKEGETGIPFLYPGTTSIAGLFLASPPGIHVSERQKGDAAAVLAAAVMPRGPRTNRGYTVVVDEERCRGCGRCIRACAYRAVRLQKNQVAGWHAVVDEALCKGCGNCISVCPSNAADSPYRDQRFLEQILEEVLIH